MQSGHLYVRDHITTSHRDAPAHAASRTRIHFSFSIPHKYIFRIIVISIANDVMLFSGKFPNIREREKKKRERDV